MIFENRTALSQEADDYAAEQKKLKCGHLPGVGFTPITEYAKLKTLSPCNTVLDWIAGAAEEGYLTAENFREMTFQKKSDWGKFLEDMREYEYWLNERHAYAFVELLDYSSPDDFMTYEGLADALSSELD